MRAGRTSLGVAGIVALTAAATSAVALDDAVPIIPTLCATSAGVEKGEVGAGAGENSGYYAIDLVPTTRVPGTGGARGTAQVTFARSPFGVAVASAGSYAQALDIRIEGLRPRASGVFVAWAASSDLKRIVRLGVLDAEAKGHIAARVEWNKFLVIVTFESAQDALGDQWQGPIVMRGMSRSGLMHTMAGHGPFEVEPCLKYGYR